MHVSLIFPPFCDPRAPQLALPSLAAVLRRNGIGVAVHDLNLRAIVGLCDGERLTDIHARLAARFGREQTTALGRVVRTAERLIERAPAALRDLRDPAFFDPMRFAAARGTIDDVLRVASLATPGLDVGLSPIRYAVDGINPASLRDLVAVTARPELELFGHATDGLLRELARERPTLAGITITNRQQIIPGLTIARRLRAAGHFVVIGGAVFSKFREELIRRPDFFAVFADAVVVYEGETALLALVDAVGHAKPLKDVPNLLFLDGDRVVATSTHVEDVRALPTQKYDYITLVDYKKKNQVLPILTGKGCYFNRCKFCDIPFINHISRKAYRVRGAEQVVEDVHALHRRYGASHFVITDEALSPKLLGDLADAFEDRPGDFAMTGYARPEPGFTAEACRRIAGFGMRKLFFGMESGSQTTLDHMDKAIDVAKVPAILANCRAAGIDFHLFGIIGLPQETRGEARKTLDFLLDNKAAINSPGSSFDVHPFGLELRTPYFTAHRDYAIGLRQEALHHDFVIGLDDGDWDNREGLSAAEAKDIIAAEMMPALKRSFQDWHAMPDPLWPPQEEYSVLYSKRWGSVPFPWRSRLPADDDTPIAFAANAVAFGWDGGDGVPVETLDLSARLPQALVRMLLGSRTLTLREHVAAADGALTLGDARQYAEALIELGLLAIRIPTAVPEQVPA